MAILCLIIIIIAIAILWPSQGLFLNAIFEYNGFFVTKRHHHHTTSTTNIFFIIIIIIHFWHLLLFLGLVYWIDSMLSLYFPSNVISLSIYNSLCGLFWGFDQQPIDSLNKTNIVSHYSLRHQTVFIVHLSVSHHGSWSIVSIMFNDSWHTTSRKTDRERRLGTSNK